MTRAGIWALGSLSLLPAAHAEPEPPEAGPVERLHDLDLDLARLAEQQKALELQRDELDLALGRAQERLLRARTEAGRVERTRARRLLGLRRIGRALPAAAILGSRSLAQLVRRRLAIQVVLKHDRRLAEDHEERLAALTSATREAGVVRERLAALARALAEVGAAVAAGRADRDTLVEALARDREVARAAALELHQAGDRVGALTRVRGARTRRRGVPPPPFESGRGVMEPPAKGRIHWDFGAPRDPRFPAAGTKTGVDVEAPPGTVVRSVWDGRVAFSGWLPGLGQVVVIEHDGGWHTVYGHLARTSARPGDRVGRGAPLGEVGDTGSWEGARLHFEVRRGATPRDPKDWLLRR